MNVGARQRSFHLIRGLSSIGDVQVVALDKTPPPDEVRAFLEAANCSSISFVNTSTCEGLSRNHSVRGLLMRIAVAAKSLFSPLPESVRYWWSDALVMQLKELHQAGVTDLVYASQSWMAEHARAAGFERIVVDLDDLLSTIAWQQLSFTKWQARKTLEILRARQETAYERALPKRFERVIVAKEEDRAFFPGDRGRVHVVPNGITLPLPALSPALPRKDIRPNQLLFVGTLGYPPNVDAIQYLVREVLPQIWEKRPDVQLQIAGFGDSSHLTPLLADDRISVAESPPNLGVFYASANLVVAPIRFGGGTRIKVLEAFAYRKPVVSTTFAAEGLHTTSGCHLVYADNAKLFAAECLKVLANDELSDQLGTNGYLHVAAKFDWRRIEEHLGEFIQTIRV